MKNWIRITLAISLMSGILPTVAKDFDDERAKMRKEIEEFRNTAKEELETFRQQINREYAEALANPWEKIHVDPIIITPPEPEPEPPVWDDEDDDNIRRDGVPLPIKNVAPAPAPAPRPNPVEPINPAPLPNPVWTNSTFYGTNVKYRNHEWKDFSLQSAEEKSISDAWEWLSRNNSDHFLKDMLTARDALHLPDWGYFKLIDSIIAKDFRSGSSAHTVIMAFVLSQSGYKVRMIRKDSGLHLFFASSGILYDHAGLSIDGDKYWSYTPLKSGEVFVSNVKFPGEKEMSLSIPESPAFSFSPGNRREIEVVRNPSIKLDVTVNKNLIDFFNDYPAGTTDNTPYSRWANIARTPSSKALHAGIYEKLRPIVKGKNQKEAINLLLKVAQTFPYKLDDEMWGDDRAFWMEESWHYPFSDCEDHAIHFVKLIKNILGLHTALIYYPGHLYAAIAPTDNSLEGDYIMYQGRKYIVCDPTYFYAPAGKTAPGMDNSQAVLIPVN